MLALWLQPLVDWFGFDSLLTFLVAVLCVLLIIKLVKGD